MSTGEGPTEPPALRITQHARHRMADRGVTVADIETALARPAVPVGPGKVGTVVIDGHCRGEILRVGMTTDRRTVVSVMWREGGGRV